MNKKLYEKIIKDLKSKSYEFRKIFDDIEKHTNKKQVILRHDVDVSIEAALELSSLENKLEVSSTYFFLVDSDNYNLLEPNNIAKVKDISENGHHIGLHFNFSNHKIFNDSDLIKCLDTSFNIFQSVLEPESFTPKVFSFHNTSKDALLYNKVLYNSYWNAYSQSLLEKCKYVSDSNGLWHYDDIETVIKQNHKNLYFLSHPEWWVSKANEPADKILTFFYENLENQWISYCNVLDRTERPNVSSDKKANTLLNEDFSRDNCLAALKILRKIL